MNAEVVKQKPVVSYFNGNDPTYFLSDIHKKLTDINIIRTKRINDDFIKFAILNKHRLYLHVIINGQGSSDLEPKIPKVKDMFDNIVKLLEAGFDKNKILIVVDPIIQNGLGIKSLELMMKVMLRYRGIRLRYIKFNLLPYYKVDLEKTHFDKLKKSTSSNLYIKKQQDYQEHKQTYDSSIISKKNIIKFKVANKNIANRPSFKKLNHLFDHGMNSGMNFMFAFKRIVVEYQSIINIDYHDYVIGLRELKEFGFNNRWTDVDGNLSRIIDYDKKTKKPMVNLLYGKNPISCPNKCVLCPFR